MVRNHMSRPEAAGPGLANPRSFRYDVAIAASQDASGNT